MSFSLIVDRDSLLAELQICAAIVERKATTPILLNVLLSLNRDGLLSLAATDLTLTIRSTIETKSRNSFGGATADAAKLLSIIRMAPDEAVQLSLDERGMLTITSGSAEFELPTLPDIDFPTLPEPPANAAVTMDAEDFAGVLRSVLFAITSDVDVRGWTLNGVCIRCATGSFEGAATDGKRVAAASAHAGGEMEPIVLVKPGVLAALKFVMPGTLEISTDGRHTFFAVANRTLAVHRDDGTFPEYEGYFEAGEREVMADRMRLRDAISRAMLMSSGHAVMIDFAPGRASFTAKTQEGRSSDVIPIDYSGPTFQAKINGKYVVEFLDVLSQPSISWKFFHGAKALNPAIITPLATDPPPPVDARYAVVPLDPSFR